MGGHGSGLSRKATEAVERLLAALLNGDNSAVQDQVLALNMAHKAGASRMSGGKAKQLLEKAVSSLGLDVRNAEPQPIDHLGDVRVVLGTGEVCWIEVKAQTKKEKFSEIVQADYVRDGTDFLRRFYSQSSDFRVRISPELRLDLEIDKPIDLLDTWSLESLWIADLALLDTVEKKKAARVLGEDDLSSFLERKFLLHLCMSGVRYVRLDDLGPIRSLLSGSKLHANVKINKGSAAAVQVSAGRMPAHATTDFTYHVGFRNAAGRHKLHDAAWITSANVVEIVS